jgi:hypothetical protein
MPEPTLIHDAGEYAIASLITEAGALAAYRRTHADVASAMTALRRTSGIDAAPLHPRAAVPLLIDLRARLEERARRNASAYSPHRWLWYLRRVPDLLLEGRVSTTLSYAFALAEVLTAETTGGEEPAIRGGFATFRVDEHVVRHVLSLAMRTRHIARVHSLIRMASKGCDLTFDADGMPDVRCAAGLEESMRLFDDRAAASEELLSRAGTPLPLHPSWDNMEETILACYRIDPQVIAVPDEDVADARMRACFQPVLASADRLKEFSARFAGLPWWQPEAVPLTLLLALAPHLVQSLPRSEISLMRFGYLATKTAVLHAVWDAYGPKAVALTQEILGTSASIASCDDLLKQLRALKGSAWPLVAPSPVRGNDSVIALELHGATSRLGTAFEFPLSDGPVANVRAEHFESGIQSVIDGSAWKPSDPIRQLRGRGLRLNGQTLTDIDAIGARSDALLLVSAKSRVYTARYDTGDHAQVRNAAAMIEKAVADWTRVTALLAGRPRGDNYDFTGLTRFIGVVCTPNVVWVPLGAASAEVAPGLRAAVSLEELEQWLASS